MAEAIGFRQGKNKGIDKVERIPSKADFDYKSWDRLDEIKSEHMFNLLKPVEYEKDFLARVPVNQKTLKNRLLIFFDGLCEPINPGGVATWGFLIIQEKMEVTHELVRKCGVIGAGKKMTNNIAEFKALLEALKFIRLHFRHPYPGILISGDSSLVINQLNGRWRVRSDTSMKYVPLLLTALKGMKWSASWISRSMNNTADRLSRKAYEDYCIASGRKIRYMHD